MHIHIQCAHLFPLHYRDPLWILRALYWGTVRRAVRLKSIDVSEEYISFIFRVVDQSKRKKRMNQVASSARYISHHPPSVTEENS
jgi:hypothetical protein